MWMRTLMGTGFTWRSKGTLEWWTASAEVWGSHLCAGAGLFCWSVLLVGIRAQRVPRWSSHGRGKESWAALPVALWGVSCLRLSFGEAGLSQQRYSRSCIVPAVWLIACKCAAAPLYIADIFIARGRIICLSPRSEELLENGCIFWTDCFWRWGTGLQNHRMVRAHVYSRTAESPLLFAGNWPCGTGNSHGHLRQSNCSFSGPAERSRGSSNNDPPVCVGGGTLLKLCCWQGQIGLEGQLLETAGSVVIQLGLGYFYQLFHSLVVVVSMFCGILFKKKNFLNGSGCSNLKNGA